MFKTKSGFTIVELLIVIVVIAILAAITIVAYNGIQNRANDSAVKGDLTAAFKLMKMYGIDNGNVYPASPSLSIGIKASRNAYMPNRNNFYYCVNSDNTKFAFAGISTSNQNFSISSDTPLREGETSGGDNACALIGGGAWVSGRVASGAWAGWVN